MFTIKKVIVNLIDRHTYAVATYKQFFHTLFLWNFNCLRTARNGSFQNKLLPPVHATYFIDTPLLLIVAGKSNRIILSLARSTKETLQLYYASID